MRTPEQNVAGETSLDGLAQPASLRWYFVCDRCNAKWFSPIPNSDCPRCGRPSKSTTQAIPPWLSFAASK